MIGQRRSTGFWSVDLAQGQQGDVSRTIYRYRRCRQSFRSTAVANEAHLQIEFMRFAEYSDQVLFSEIGPKNRVTALLMPYFTDRLPSEPFIIYDKNHQEAGVWTGKGRWYMMRGAETEPLQALSGKTDQSEYAALWSAFFHQIGIKERENPACQRTRLPFRYRKYMTEFQSGSNRSNLAKL